LADLHPDIERDHVGDEAIRRQFQILQFRREPEAMHETEDQDRESGIGFDTEDRLEAAEILECLVDDGYSDDGVDEIRIDVKAAEHAEEQRRAVADAEQRHIERDMAQLVEKEDDAKNK